MRTKKGVWIAVVFFAIIVMVHITMFVLHHMNRSYPDAVRLSDGWTVSGAANYENAALEDVEFEPVKRGDEYTFQRVLPQDTVLFPVLEIYLVHCATRVYVDDEVIYEYGFEQYEKKKLLLNKPVQLAFDSGENSFDTYLEDLFIITCDKTLVFNKGQKFEVFYNKKDKVPQRVFQCFEVREYSNSYNQWSTRHIMLQPFN